MYDMKCYSRFCRLHTGNIYCTQMLKGHIENKISLSEAVNSIIVARSLKSFLLVSWECFVAHK